MSMDKTPASISQDCLLGGCAFGASGETKHSFRAFLCTVCATSKTEHEPQGGEKANAELDV
ncbi:MAG: hypothetical protein J6K47_06930 [Clostridia bacterium]|nr:hypothetical protein [Clostridia bacterium]